MKTSEETKQITSALVKFAAEMGRIPKEANNPFFNSRYADLATILSAVRGPLSVAGLAIVQGVAIADDALTITTRIMHASGEWIECDAVVAAAKRDPQGYGSAMTYGRRYGLQAALNITAEEDDDANAATPQQAEAHLHRPASEKQIRMIKGVAAELHGTGAADYVSRTLQRKSIASLEALTMSQARTWIESMVDEKKKRASAPDELDFPEEVAE